MPWTKAEEAHKMRECLGCGHKFWQHTDVTVLPRFGVDVPVRREGCAWEGCKCPRFMATEVDHLLEELIR